MSSRQSVPRLRVAIAAALMACLSLLGPADDARRTALAAEASSTTVSLAVSAYHWEPITPGATIEYEIDYENYDEATVASNTVLTVSLPAGSIFVGSTRGGTDFPPSSQVAGPELTYDLQPVGPLTSDSILVRVQMPGNLTPGAQVTLSATISASETDADLADNTSQDTAEVAAPDLSISVWPSDDSGAFAPEATITYTLEYYNLSSDLPAPGVRITDVLPSGLSFVQALWNNNGTLETPEAIQPQVLATGERVFNVGELAANGAGRIQIIGKLDASLPAGRLLSHRATIGTHAAEADYENNQAEDEQVVVATKPDLWTRVSSSTDGEIGGVHDYYMEFGNNGPLPASNVVLTITLPSQIQLAEEDIYPAPTSRPSPNVAVWQLGTLDAWSTGESISLSGIIQAAGTAQLSASITGSGGEANPEDNVSQVSDELVAIHMPTIGGPSGALIGATPVFYGLGKPGATVSLYISSTVAVQGQLIGTAPVGDDGVWEIPTPDGALPSDGWYWFTASQNDGTYESDVTGAGNYVDHSLGTDSNSVTINGQRAGGLDQTYEWVTGQTYSLGASVSCPGPYTTPLTPTLMARLFNDGGLMTGYRRIQPSSPVTGTQLLFDFQTPDEGSFTLTLEYYCRSDIPTSPGQLGSAAATKISDLWHPERWFGGSNDDKPDPPKPPNPGCPGCTPIERPKPKPKPKDPDGFVYDAYSVQGGSSMAQSLVTNAEVTCMRKANTGDFQTWNALEYNQVNPQKTDGIYPDNVLRLGYYSFLVPPGSYRIQVTAPGYLPYVSPVLQVVNSPVTWHVPLQREHQPLAVRANRIFLPMLARH